MNWTKGIDPKTGKPVEYDPSKKLQQYTVVGTRTTPEFDICPDPGGGVNFYPTAQNRAKLLVYGAGIDGCSPLKVDEPRMGGPFWNGGATSRAKRLGGVIAAVDSATGRVKVARQLDCPDNSGVLATAGGLVFSGTLDGTFTAFDDEELKAVMELQRWHGDHRSTYQLLGQWQAIRRGPRRRWP